MTTVNIFTIGTDTPITIKVTDQELREFVKIIIDHPKAKFIGIKNWMIDPQRIESIKYDNEVSHILTSQNF